MIHTFVVCALLALLLPTFAAIGMGTLGVMVEKDARTESMIVGVALFMLLGGINGCLIESLLS